MAENVDPFVDTLGRSPKDYASLGELPITEKIILKYVGKFILNAIETLKRQKRVDTGELSSSIVQGDLINDQGNYSIAIGYPEGSEASKYYDFVNKGVQGWESGRPNSIYKYSKKNPSTNGPFVMAIEKWVKRKGLQTLKENKRSQNPAIQKRLSISKIPPTRSTAWVIARSIKRKGLERSGFIDDSITSAFGPEFLNAIGKAVGGDVRVYIRQAVSLSK